MRKIKKLILSVTVCASLLFVGMCSLNDVQASADTDYTESQILDYIANKTAPSKDNKVFAGWYTDTTYTTPVTSASEVDDNTVAKFVDEAVLTLKLQVSARTSATSEVADIRFLSSVDSLNYQNVSFTVDSTGSYDPVFAADTAYTSVIAGGNTYSPEIFSTDSKRIVTAVWDGIGRGTNGVTNDATSNFGKTIKVTPSWTTMDGTVVTGTSREFEINDGLYEAEINDTNPSNETTDGNEHVWGTLSEAVIKANDTGQTGTAIDKHVVITLLKDAAPTGTLTISKDITIQNVAGKNITIKRGTSHTSTMFNIINNASLQLVEPSDGANARLIIDAYSETAIPGRIVTSGNDDSLETQFYLGKGVTMQNAHSSLDQNAKGGAALYNRGTATIAGTITNNKQSNAHHGGGVYNRGTLILDGGEISHNSCTRFGAGVYSEGTFIMKSGTISNNNTTETHATNNTYARGGGVYIFNNSTFTMNGGTIESNSCGHIGGGVCVFKGTFTMNGGTITDTNTATQGAGVYVYKGTTFTQGEDATVPENIVYRAQ